MPQSLADSRKVSWRNLPIGFLRSRVGKLVVLLKSSTDVQSNAQKLVLSTGVAIPRSLRVNTVRRGLPVKTVSATQLLVTRSC